MRSTTLRSCLLLGLLALAPAALAAPAKEQPAAPAREARRKKRPLVPRSVELEPPPVWMTRPTCGGSCCSCW